MNVIRWWQSKVNLITLWSLVELALPVLLLTDFEVIGFSTQTAAIIVLVVKLVNVAATIAARNVTTSVVGTKAEVEATK